MANKRVGSGRGRKPGVVKASKKSSSNSALYVLIAVVAIGGIAALTYYSSRSTAQPGASQFDSTLAPVVSSGYVLGSPSAPLEVTEFGDFECPQCSHFAVMTEPDVRTRLVNTGKIRWRYIDFPLPMHGNTWNASRAAACADEQGKFWQMHDLLFETQDKWNSETTSKPDKYFEGLAEQLGLQMPQYNQCVSSKKYQAKIQAHLKLAEDAQIGGTPTFIINRQQKEGFLSYDQFAAWVDQELAKGGTASAHTAAVDSAKKQ